MGDRANVYVKQAEVFLYSHWGGEYIAVQLQQALRSAPDRWGDYSYLARIIFREMGAGEPGSTGFGISHLITDNQRPVLLVDCERCEVSRTSGLLDQLPNIERATDPISFSRYVEMSEQEINQWFDPEDADES